MNSQTVKLLLLACLIFQAGCDITFKRKNNNHKTASVGTNQVEINKDKTSQSDNNIDKEVAEKNIVRSDDDNIIIAYYKDPTNDIILNDMLTHTKTSKKQEKNLVVGKIIPRNIQVVPLPLSLERILSSLPLRLIRVQIGNRVIIMNARTREILTVLKI